MTIRFDCGPMPSALYGPFHPFSLFLFLSVCNNPSVCLSAFFQHINETEVVYIVAYFPVLLPIISAKCSQHMMGKFCFTRSCGFQIDYLSRLIVFGLQGEGGLFHT